MQSNSVTRTAVSVASLLLLAPSAARAELRHHWPLDETAGLSARDVVSGADGSLVNFELNDDSQWVDGEFNGALNLGADASFNNYVQVDLPAMDAAVTGGFSIAMWLKPGFQIFNPGEYQLLSTPGDSIGLTIMNNTFEGVVHDRVLLFWDGNAANITVGTTSLDPDVWYHVVLTSEGVGGAREYYVDGVREDKVFLLPSQGGQDLGTRDGWPAGSAQIGAINGGRVHDSVLDDVRIYDHVLSEDEVLDIIDNPPPEPPRIDSLLPPPGDLFHTAGDGFSFEVSSPGGLASISDDAIIVRFNSVDIGADLTVGGTDSARTVSFDGLEQGRIYEVEIEVSDSAGGTARLAYVFGTLTQVVEPGLRHLFLLDEDSGRIAADLASGAIGRLVNFENDDDSQWVDGWIDGALDLASDDTRDNYVQFPISELNAFENGGFTIAMWIRPGAEILSPGEYQLLMTPGDAVGFTIVNNVFEGVLHDRVLLFWDGLAANITVGTTTLEPGSWYHVAVSSQGISGDRHYYVNGIEEEKRFLLPSQGGVDLGTNDGWLAGSAQIGAWNGGARGHGSTIDDVRIYDVVLSPGEIEDLVGDIPAAPLEITDVSPADGTAFATAAGGLGFTVRTPNPGATIAPEDIRVMINGRDASAELEVTGTETDRSVALGGLEPEKAYLVEIEAVDSAGGSALLRLRFGTVTQSIEDGLRHHYRFDEGEGLLAIDAASGAIGRLINFEDPDGSRWQPGQLGGALSLAADDTIDNSVEIDLSAMDAFQTFGFTIAMWVNPGAAILNSGEYQLLRTPGDGIGFTIMNLDRPAIGENFDRNLLFWDGDPANIVTGTTSLEPGTWYHVAVTSFGQGGERQIYVNGVKEAKRLFNPDQGGIDIGTSDGWAAGVGQIGGFFDARHHDSIFDDVRIYERVLEEDEIAELASSPDMPPTFLRGDTDGSGVVDISDPIFNLTVQFVGGGASFLCVDAADVDDSGVNDISDPIYSLTFQFVGGLAPPPAPGSTSCGPDPTADALDCAAYPLEKCP